MENDKLIETIRAMEALLREIQEVMNEKDQSSWWMSMDKRIDKVLEN